MSEIIAYDYQLFKLINSFSGQNAFLDAFSVFLAQVLVIVMVIIVLGLLVYWRKYWLRIFLSALFVLAINLLADKVYFRPRPFVSHPVIQLINKSASEKSFPSGHASFAFTLAFSALFIDRRWGSLLLFLAILVSLGRILVGVHYPVDVLAGALLGFAVSGLGWLLAEKLWPAKHLDNNNRVPAKQPSGQ